MEPFFIKEHFELNADSPWRRSAIMHGTFDEDLDLGVGALVQLVGRPPLREEEPLQVRVALQEPIQAVDRL